MMKIKFLFGIVLGTILFSACDDNTDTLGNSLTNIVDRFEIISDTFEVKTRSVIVDSVLSQSQYSYLGHIKDTETGTYVTSNYMSQFAILESLDGSKILPDKDKISSLNTVNNIVADSCRLQIYFYSSIGDSLNPMKLTAYEMETPMREDTTYYTNFNPEKLLRKDAHALKVNKVYTPVDLNMKDSLRNLVVNKTNMEVVLIPLNDKYQDKEQQVYENYGTYIMRKFYEHPEYFKNSYNFIHNVCPGFYIKSTDGLGVMSEVYMTELAIFYKYKEGDQENNGTLLLSGTEEVMQATNIVYDKESIKNLVDNDTCTYLKTPAGIFTEVTLPVDEIKFSHENDNISSAKISFNRIVTPNEDKTIGTPTTILMIPKDSLYSFFENKDLPDSKTSFVGTYNETYRSYTFNNISSLINNMYDVKQKGKASENWNKVILVPISISYNTSSSTSSITNVSNEMQLKSTRLVGGSQNRHQPITISVIYNKSIRE